MINGRIEQTFEFPPGAIVRAATWPLESLDSFGDDHLAALALQAAATNDSTCPDYVKSYKAVLDRERDALWRMTTEDDLFMKALLLSNPQVARRARGSASKRGSRSKNIRHLEVTLFRYLGRACGRTVPNGLWAGVGLVRLSETACYASSSSRYLFAPDLRPFQSILRSLGRRPDYRSAALWRANATLSRQGNGDWRYWAKTRSGELDRREVEQDQRIDLILETINKLGSGTFSEIINTAEADESFLSTLEELADAGAFVGGLDLPNRFATAWEALSIAGARLTFQDRVIWDTCQNELQSICSELSRLKAITFEELEERLNRATASVEELAARLDLPLPDIPDPLLRCDSALMFDLSLGAEQQEILLQALREYERIWINGMSPATALRTEVRSLFGKYLEKDIPLQEVDWHWNDSGGLRGASHRRVLFRLQELEKEITREHDEVVLGSASSQQDDSPTAPVACFYAGMFEGFRLVVHGLGEDPARAFARHAALLDLGELQEWLTRHLQDLAQRHAIRIAQLCVPFERNPNVLASPDFGALRVELWDSNAGALSLNGAKFVLDPVSRMPFLTLPGLAEPTAVFCFASADIGASDPISRQLLWTAFQDTPEPNLGVPAMTLQCERDVPSFAPRMCLPGGAILRARRTVLAGGRLTALARLRGSQRYVAWQQLAESYQWPELLLIQRDDEPPMFVKRNSPLALESVFKGIKDRITSLTVEEAPGRPWLTDSDARHYMAEIALPFARGMHSWSRSGET